MRKLTWLPHHRPFDSTPWWFLTVIAATLGIGWLFFALYPAIPSADPKAITQHDGIIQGPHVVTMNSSSFDYTNDWEVSEHGADPQEPADPWQEPAGSFSFHYQGSDLALALALGNYWGYLYVTVDGQPANQLAVIRGNRNSQGEDAGYRTFYAPEAQGADGPTPQWVLVHRASDPAAMHTVRVEVWRSWGQWPIRGVAVDAAQPARRPLWPGISLLLLAAGSTFCAVHTYAQHWPEGSSVSRQQRWSRLLRHLLLPRWLESMAPWMAAAGTGMIALAVWADLWPLTLAGLGLLGWAGLQRPVLWLGAAVVSYPFYFSYPLPILPGRALGLIDVGILGGFAVSIGHRLLLQQPRPSGATKRGRNTARGSQLLTILILLMTSWALLATVEANQLGVALREWRTVFLYAALFAITLQLTLQAPQIPPTQRAMDQRLLLGGWLLGGTLVAAVGLWQYMGDVMLIEAEGVHRVRAFYGSPNNLALYLERTFALTLALTLFTRRERLHWGWLTVTLLQGTALILTFSKGALLLALPATFAVLWLGGLLLLRRRGESLRMLWWLTAIAIGIGIALLPFVATDRFRQLLVFGEGTGFIRLQLWQSSWQMALDHPWFGVGPDNFLYAYRSIYILPAAWQEPNLNHPHNWLLDWWTRLGMPGLLLALTWFGVLVRHQWQQLTREQLGDQSRENSVLSLGLLAATAAALAHGLIDASYALPDLMLIWVLMSYLSLDPPNRHYRRISAIPSAIVTLFISPK